LLLLPKNGNVIPSFLLLCVTPIKNIFLNRGKRSVKRSALVMVASGGGVDVVSLGDLAFKPPRSGSMLWRSAC
jgi:hypothetical protein